MINQYLHNSIPLTRLFLLNTIFALIASSLLFYKLFLPLAISLIIIFCITYIKKQNYLLFYVSIISTLIIVVRLHQIESYYTQHHNLLQKPVVVQGIIKNVIHNLQDKQNSIITLSTSSIRDKELGPLKIKKVILIQIPYSRAKDLTTGQWIRIYNIQLTQPKEDDNYKLYLLKEGVWATGFVYKEKFITSKKLYSSWYQKYFNYLSHYFNNQIDLLYNPLFLGKKEKNIESLTIQHQSLYWGIAHHMARSGIHLITILSLFVALFHYCKFFHRFRFLLYTALVFLYALISIPNISFIRSLCMITIQMFTKFNGFIYSGIHAYLLTALILIHYNPLAIFFLDFQLSFGITAIIMWLFFIKWNKIIAF